MRDWVLIVKGTNEKVWQQYKSKTGVGKQKYNESESDKKMGNRVRKYGRPWSEEKRRQDKIGLRA